jgi:SAM-dependent methyltransferase
MNRPPPDAGRLPVMEGSGEVERIHLARYDFASRYVAGKSVLDLATGIGYGAARLRNGGGAAAVTGADISAEAIAVAREQYGGSGVDYRVVGGGPLPFADGCFDVVVSLETIEHTPDPGGFVSELRRVLKPGGPLIISTPNRTFHSLGRRIPWNPHHTTELKVSAFHQLLQERIGEPEFWGGQEFLPVTLRSVIRTNWMEFRYYRLLGHPLYTILHRILRGLKGGSRRAPDAEGGQTEGNFFRENVVPWVDGAEPYTMVAVCRKPIT